MTDVKVEQCDRVAAAGTIPDDGSHVSHMMVDAILNGRADDWPLVLAFARHRQAAEKATRERDAGIAEDWIDEAFATDHENRIARSIATAIRSQNDG